MIIRVKATDDKHNEILERLRDLGVEVTTGEETVGESALFYLGRINSKLDNLGQLRHLHKFSLTLSDIKNAFIPISAWFAYKVEEFTVREKMNRKYFRDLSEAYQMDAPLPDSLKFMTKEEIRELFA